MGALRKNDGIRVHAEQLLSKLKNATKLSAFREPSQAGRYAGNIENFIGLTQVPTGLVQGLCINGEHAKGAFKVPLATTEGALVASYNRGAAAIAQSGGADVRIASEGLQRCPAFRFDSMLAANEFVAFARKEEAVFAKLVTRKSAYAKLIKVDYLVLGNLVLLTFWFQTGDAAGQNMVTFCTDAICEYLATKSPIDIQDWYIESNMSGDKKATAANMSTVRGKRLLAEVIVPRAIVHAVLKTSPETIFQYYQCALTAAMHSGALGMQGHFANGLAALFLATGNDVACVAEAACGLTLVEITESGDLRVSVVIPCFVAGTVGGGTNLSTQQEALQIMECAGKGKSKKFAEISAGLVLAGELSIMAALAAGQFTQAHKNLGR